MAAPVKREKYANRYRGRLTFGASAATGVQESFNTGMNIGAGSAYKWTLLAASIQPNTFAGLVVPSTFSLQAQLAIGNQTGMLDQDDMQCISTVARSTYVSAGGANAIDWPLVFPIHSPIPVFAQALTISLVGTNVATLNSIEFAYDLWYVTSPVNKDEMLEYLAAFGQV